MEVVMRDKLPSTVSTLALNEGKAHNGIDIFFPKNAVYIKLLATDDPLWKLIKVSVSESSILYVLRKSDGGPLEISDDIEQLTAEAGQDDKILFTLH